MTPETTAPIVIRELTTGYWHARGNGPCNWAQWPTGTVLTDDAFFPEAGLVFRAALTAHARTALSGVRSTTGSVADGPR